MNIFKLNKYSIYTKLLTLMVVTVFLCQNFAVAGEYSNKLSAKSRWSTYGLESMYIDGFICATNKLEKAIEKQDINSHDFNRNILDEIITINADLTRLGYKVLIVIPPDRIIPKIALEAMGRGGTTDAIHKACLTFSIGNVKELDVLFNVIPEELTLESRATIGIKKEDDYSWIQVPGTEKIWIVSREFMDSGKDKGHCRTSEIITDSCNNHGHIAQGYSLVELERMKQEIKEKSSTGRDEAAIELEEKYQDVLQDYNGKRYEIVLFEAVVEAENEFVLGWREEGKIYLAKEVVERAVKSGESVIKELLYYEINCGQAGKDHFQMIMDQQERFPENYEGQDGINYYENRSAKYGIERTVKVYTDTEDNEVLYKGILGNVLRFCIDKKYIEEYLLGKGFERNDAEGKSSLLAAHAHLIDGPIIDIIEDSLQRKDEKGPFELTNYVDVILRYSEPRRYGATEESFEAITKKVMDGEIITKMPPFMVEGFLKVKEAVYRTREKIKEKDYKLMHEQLNEFREIWKFEVPGLFFDMVEDERIHIGFRRRLLDSFGVRYDFKEGDIGDINYDFELSEKQISDVIEILIVGIIETKQKRLEEYLYIFYIKYIQNNHSELLEELLGVEQLLSENDLSKDEILYKFYERAVNLFKNGFPDYSQTGLVDMAKRILADKIYPELEKAGEELVNIGNQNSDELLALARIKTEELGSEKERLISELQKGGDQREKGRLKRELSGISARIGALKNYRPDIVERINGVRNLPELARLLEGIVSEDSNMQSLFHGIDNMLIPYKNPVLKQKEKLIGNLGRYFVSQETGIEVELELVPVRGILAGVAIDTGSDCGKGINMKRCMVPKTGVYLIRKKGDNVPYGYIAVYEKDVVDGTYKDKIVLQIDVVNPSTNLEVQGESFFTELEKHFNKVLDACGDNYIAINLSVESENVSNRDSLQEAFKKLDLVEWDMGELETNKYLKSVSTDLEELEDKERRLESEMDECRTFLSGKEIYYFRNKVAELALYDEFRHPSTKKVLAEVCVQYGSCAVGEFDRIVEERLSYDTANFDEYSQDLTVYGRINREIYNKLPEEAGDVFLASMHRLILRESREKLSFARDANRDNCKEVEFVKGYFDFILTNIMNRVDDDKLRLEYDSFDQLLNKIELDITKIQREVDADAALLYTFSFDALYSYCAFLNVLKFVIDNNICEKDRMYADDERAEYDAERRIEEIQRELNEIDYQMDEVVPEEVQTSDDKTCIFVGRISFPDRETEELSGPEAAQALEESV